MGTAGTLEVPFGRDQRMVNSSDLRQGPDMNTSVDPRISSRKLWQTIVVWVQVARAHVVC